MAMRSTYITELASWRITRARSLSTATFVDAAPLVTVLFKELDQSKTVLIDKRLCNEHFQPSGYQIQSSGGLQNRRVLVERPPASTCSACSSQAATCRLGIVLNGRSGISEYEEQLCELGSSRHRRRET